MPQPTTDANYDQYLDDLAQSHDERDQAERDLHEERLEQLEQGGYDPEMDWWHYGL
jgi:hypothetical protein